MQALMWLFRAAVFFTLLAFSLNKQNEPTLKWFFGYESRAPMVFIVLAVFALGAAFGALAMLPSWWRHRRAARSQPETAPSSGTVAASTETGNGEAAAPLTQPPRDGL